MLRNTFSLKKWLGAIAIAAGVLAPVNQSASALELFDDVDLPTLSLPDGENGGPDFGGWTNYGYRGDSESRFNLNFNDNQSQFGSQQRHGLNQLWFYLEQVADGSDGVGYGYRADVMYGLDADDTVAFGASNSFDNRHNFNHGIYGFAIPQLYGEVAYGDWSMKAGHFYTLVGYEVVPATGNFFYSHAYTMFNNEPFTHTGVLSTYKASENVTLYNGYTLGWDTGFDRFDDGGNFLGGASVGVGDNLTVTYILTVGDLGWRGEGYSHSIVADFALTDKWNYVFQTDLVETNSAAAGDPNGDHQFAFNQYLFYTINDKLKAGLRAEWWKTGGGAWTTAAFGAPTGSLDIYEVTAGLNIAPMDNVMIRPEVRHDWSGDFLGTSINYTTAAVDVIVSF
ncbi:MAG TPA: outer membrane beta-barrel protein [Planctomycetaceae bacterium]|nr:outer membrane beta-barrel protein [Planctomycetaceae bacterium]